MRRINYGGFYFPLACPDDAWQNLLWMMAISNMLYRIFTGSYFAAIHIAAFFQFPKAKKWVAGRKTVFDELTRAFTFQQTRPEPVIWFHCASLGEFEQGRPLIELIREEKPDAKILLTFFSPSGYDVRKNYPLADWVFYLPADTPANARRFLQLVRPALAVFVKYEFWLYYLREIHSRNIPLFLVAAVFRSNQLFFQYPGAIYRQLLHFFDHIFVQDKDSATLLAGIGCHRVTAAGDPRIDRVLTIAAAPERFPDVEKFCGEQPVLVAGSTWPPDETILHHWWTSDLSRGWKLILAPHDVAPDRIAALQAMFGRDARLFSRLENVSLPARVLIVDGVGQLSSLYQFGQVAYIGGGFGKAIHNTLEPMAFNLPVLYGPHFQKFTEAVTMIREGGHFAIRSDHDFLKYMTLLAGEQSVNQAKNAVAHYMSQNKGATKAIYHYLKNYL